MVDGQRHGAVGAPPAPIWRLCRAVSGDDGGEADPRALPGRLISEAMEKAIKLPAIICPHTGNKHLGKQLRPLNSTDSILAGIRNPHHFPDNAGEG